MKKLIHLGAFCGLSLLTGLSAHAHIVLDVQSASAGSYYRGALRVGHGCDGSPVRQIVVTIPGGVQGAKPMPKPGWDIEIKRKVLAQPYVSHGRTVSEDVSQIRWTAKTPADYLQPDHFDEFVVFAKLPETAGKLYWKTSQLCEQGRIDWHEVPASDAAPRPKTPAAVLDVQPKAEAHDVHAHHKH